MKTICFVVHTFPSISETFVVNQIVGAKKQGYSVCILTYRLETLEQSSQRDLIEKYGLLKDTILINYKIPISKIKQLTIGLALIMKYFKYWIKPSDILMKHRFLNWPFLFEFFCKFRHIDIFHIQYASMGTAIAELKDIDFLKAKIITTFHGHDAHYKNEKELQYLQNNYNILFKVCDYVTVNTPYLEANVIEIGCKKEKLRIIPMAVDVDYFKSNTIKELPIKSGIKLISIGRLIEFKGFKYAINAIKLLVDQDINVHYTIVGEGALLKSLQDQIQILELDDHVKLVGRQSQDEIKTALEVHHVFLMSSISDKNGRCETQGVVTAEAQAMGLPVVAFNNGGIPYTIVPGETGFLVKEKDIEAYAKVLLKLMNRPEEYQIMSEKAKEFAAANYSIHLMTERFNKLYEE